LAPLNSAPLMEERQVLRVGRDHSFNVFIYQGSIHREGSAEKSDVPACVGEANKLDAALSPREALSVQDELRQ
jgi:hypothetical protein